MSDAGSRCWELPLLREGYLEGWLLELQVLESKKRILKCRHASNTHARTHAHTHVHTHTHTYTHTHIVVVVVIILSPIKEGCSQCKEQPSSSD